MASPLDLGTRARSGIWCVLDTFPQLSLWSKGASQADLAELNAKGRLEFDIDPMQPGAKAPDFDPDDAFYVPFHHATSMIRPGPRIQIWKLSSTAEMQLNAQ